ncbi:hypothetical protein [Caudoviricetes sp.]|nr:hypothetical protein [Caudoviricetes sp.]
MPTEPTPSAKDPHDMTDQELTEAVAVEVMGWHKVHARQNGYAITWIWASANRDQNEFWDFTEEMSWNPTKDWNDTMDIVSRCQYFCLVTRDDGTWLCKCSDKMTFVANKLPMRAICEAALLDFRSLPKP